MYKKKNSESHRLLLGLILSSLSAVRFSACWLSDEFGNCCASSGKCCVVSLLPASPQF